MMTPQLPDEDFVLRGLEGAGKSLGSEAASTQSGPEGIFYERREGIKSESSHICVCLLVTRGLGISEQPRGQMKSSLIWCPTGYSGL